MISLASIGSIACLALDKDEKTVEPTTSHIVRTIVKEKPGRGMNVQQKAFSSMIEPMSNLLLTSPTGLNQSVAVAVFT